MTLSQILVLSNSSLFAGKNPGICLDFGICRYCYWSKPIFSLCSPHPGSCNGVNGPKKKEKKKKFGMILWESAAICSLKLSFCHACIIPQQPVWRVNWIFVSLKDAFNYFHWITLGESCDEESLMLIFWIRNIWAFIPAPIKGCQNIPGVSHPEIPSFWSRV